MRHSRFHGLVAAALVLVNTALPGCYVATTPATQSDTPPSTSRGSFDPQFTKATLTWGDQSLQPQRIAIPWSQVYTVGQRQIVIRDSKMVVCTSNNQLVWMSGPLYPKLDLRWMASDGQTVFLLGYQPGGESRMFSTQTDNPLELCRLDLATGKWFMRQPLNANPKYPTSETALTAVLAAPAGFFVLTQQTDLHNNDQDRAPVSYSLSLMKPKQDQPEWSRDFPALGSRPDPDVKLLAAAMPDTADSNIQRLTWTQEGLLVCAGEKEDLILLDATGKTKWRLPRIWEYQRGFIGPSVWAHFMARFGLEDQMFAGDDNKQALSPDAQKRADERNAKLHQAQADFDQHFECAIIGGPAIVPIHPADGPEQQRIFVAVAKGPKSWNSGYLSECLIYELDMDGKVQAMTTLPHMVVGHQFQVVPDAVVWSCNQNAMARIKAGTRAGSGPGSPDLLCPIEWYRQYTPPNRKAWLTTEPLDAVATDPTIALRTLAGGYITEKSDHVFHFPIAVLDLKTGAQRTLDLHVPFNGQVPPPDTNYTGGDDQILTRGPYLLGITRLRLHDKSLEITLGMEHTAIGLTFDLDSTNIQPPPDR